MIILSVISAICVVIIFFGLFFGWSNRDDDFSKNEIESLRYREDIIFQQVKALFKEEYRHVGINPFD